jgi:hypothetical protein
MRARLAHLAAVAVVIGMVMLGVNSGQFARNYDLYGSPFGPDGEGDRQEIKYLNEYFSGPEVASNALRNTTLQVSTPVNGGEPAHRADGGGGSQGARHRPQRSSDDVWDDTVLGPPDVQR